MRRKPRLRLVDCRFILIRFQKTRREGWREGIRGENVVEAIIEITTVNPRGGTTKKCNAEQPAPCNGAQKAPSTMKIRPTPRNVSPSCRIARTLLAVILPLTSTPGFFLCWQKAAPYKIEKLVRCSMADQRETESLKRLQTRRPWKGLEAQEEHNENSM